MRAMPLVAIVAAASALTLAGCSPPKPAAEPKAAAAPAAAQAQAPNEAPAGVYYLDLSHTSVNFRLSHLGISNYTLRFTKAAGELAFDPANPAAQSVTATIDARSVQTNYPDAATLDFDSKVEKEFLDAERFPQITFKSTKVEPTGPKTAKLTGDLTLRGVTKPITLEATFNGGYKPNAYDPMGARIGFSAKGTFKRSDFGMTYGLPAPGTTMGVGDDVDVAIEAEFTSKKAP
ncbi:YceI family protein [uncultured Phenylobacterium sp.]|uniref:YceI family protein n=1 Tax=uncultured Phenylobacterium sp. TaxID=349273 RepID=UPI0025E89B92|nr:YceI family protein [uncultured Phenylobacterium sp.]